jgi:uncharacterized protein
MNATAAAWCSKAADQGDADAQNILGSVYADGEGVPQDYVQAAAWYRKAAEQGHAAAQSNLGEMYETGRGVPQDVIMAHMWFNLAASRAMTAMDYLIRDQASQAMAMDFVTRDQALRRVMEGSWLNRDEATHRRDGLAAEMTPAEIAEAQRMAWE